MRVLHVIPSVEERSGGPAAAIVPMCRALQEQGIEVFLVTTSHGLTQTNTDSVTEYKGVPARFFEVQVGASFKYSRPLTKWLKTSVRDFDLVHIHAVFNHASVAAALVCRKMGVPYVVRPLGTLDPWSMKQKAGRKKVFWSLVGKRMLGGSAAVHYTAQGEKIATEESLGINHGRVIALGVEVDTSLLAKKATGHKYVLLLSRLDPKKNVEILIDAFKSLRDDAWSLVIAGDGARDYVASLKERARRSEKIIFTGWVEGEQKEALLRDASLFVLPSSQENFGLSVMEAMARGVPVLVSPHVNLADEIEAADAGWVVELAQLSEGLAAVVKNESERERRGEAAYQFSQQFSWQRTATELVELYQQIV
ncbi:MAG TPA: glycosyltransferase [Pyrinomonadaceae bacterium]|nr:glycosyltransferase [Pyrinomonadaceae bacterium]